MTEILLIGTLSLNSINVCPEIWASWRENLSWGFANNKGADQPAHLGSLISTFVIRLLESTIQGTKIFQYFTCPAG